MFLPRAPTFTPGYFCSFSKGSGEQSPRRLSSQRPNRCGSGPVASSKQGSLTSPKYSQRLSRLNFVSFGCEESVFTKSSAPVLALTILSQSLSFPAVHTIHVLRPLISSGVNCTPPSISRKWSSSAAGKLDASRCARRASSSTLPACAPLDFQRL